MFDLKFMSFQSTVHEMETIKQITRQFSLTGLSFRQIGSSKAKLFIEYMLPSNFPTH